MVPMDMRPSLQSQYCVQRSGSFSLTFNRLHSKTYHCDILCEVNIHTKSDQVLTAAVTATLVNWPVHDMLTR